MAHVDVFVVVSGTEGDEGRRTTGQVRKTRGLASPSGAARQAALQTNRLISGSNSNSVRQPAPNTGFHGFGIDSDIRVVQS